MPSKSHSNAAPQIDAKASSSGLLPVTAAALLAGVACWFWMSTILARQAVSSGAGPTASVLAQVAPRDIPGALTTMGGEDAFLARFRTRKGACPQPLAWVTLAGTPGQPSATVRLRSGTYFSPDFRLSSRPVRIAIPYPAPYATGRGVLRLFDAGGGATVALQPAWKVPRMNGAVSRPVVWAPTDRCPSGQG